MKWFLIYLILIFYFKNVYAQTSILPIAKLAAQSENDQWDLDKFVWSHNQLNRSIGDKPFIDFTAIDNWVSLSDLDVAISRDGQFFAYGIQNNLHRRLDTLVVQSTTSSWRQSFTGASSGFFSEDSKQYIFQNKDSLCFLRLGTSSIQYIPNVSSFKVSNEGKGEWLAYQLKSNPKSLMLRNLYTQREKCFYGVSNFSFTNNNEWLACQLNNETKQLVLYNLNTEKELYFDKVVDYLFNKSGRELLLKTQEKAKNGYIIAIRYIHLSEVLSNEQVGTIKTIWSTTNIDDSLSSYSLDDSGKQVVFTVSDGSVLDNLIIDSGSLLRPKEKSIWYWREGMDSAVVKVNNQTTGINANLMIEGTASFTNDGVYIQFLLKPRPDFRRLRLGSVQVDVWSSRDTILQSTQSYMVNESNTYKAIINSVGGKVTQLEKEYEKIKLLKGDYVVIGKSGREVNGDRFWEKDYQKDSNWLVSLKDGARHLLKTRGSNYSIWFSPKGHYLVYFDADHGCNYFSYDLKKQKVMNLSVGIPICQLGYENYTCRTREKSNIPFGIAGWLNDDKGLLVYDNYDIWQLDLDGIKPPINITNGYGRLHKILFSLMNSDRFRMDPVGEHFNEKDTLLLRAFNKQNKYNGFYWKVLGLSGNPELLYIGPCFMETLYGTNGLDLGMHPLKAADANVWIIKQQTATQAPNYFRTDDFKKFRPLTDLQPHKYYNWLTTELHSFKQLDGTISQGVLYKPENFDSSKKYPVIVTFYTHLSDRLYQYPTPGYVIAPMLFNDPAWMVSHGYLVFTPDIYFSKGKWGPSTVNTIDGAARYLRQLSFVDAQHIGACGHSNSGRFGYYLLTHSKLFAAMSVGAGTTNIISNGLSLNKPDGVSREESKLEWAESGAVGTGLGNLWRNKVLWLDQTSVLHADKVTSPLLQFHNKMDGAYSSGQAVEMFIALRRLNKKVWWLQYDYGAHVVAGQDEKDFTIRFTQFFDHYLKGAPPPRWMTQGIPAKLKGIESRYELDIEGSCGKDCPVCDAKRAVKSYK